MGAILIWLIAWAITGFDTVEPWNTLFVLLIVAVLFGLFADLNSVVGKLGNRPFPQVFVETGEAVEACMECGGQGCPRCNGHGYVPHHCDPVE